MDKWTLRNKLQWKFNRNSNIFIQEDAFENVVCKIRPFCFGLNVLIAVMELATVAPQLWPVSVLISIVDLSLGVIA